MRIIGGKLKGKAISFIKSSSTRPLKDSVKENIFNIINHSHLLKINLKNSNVLDLYSGIGSFGLECASRDAKKITFVEENKNVVKVLEENLYKLKIDNSIVITDKIVNFLNLNLSEKFEIIFLDPPFAKKDYLYELKIIEKKKIYRNKHIVIIHREKNSINDWQEVINPLIVKVYGRSKIIFGRFLN